MRLNLTTEWNVRTIWISRALPLFNFERLVILCAWIGPSSKKLWPFELLKSLHYSISSLSIYYVPESDLRVKSYDHLNFSRASVVQFRASLYVMRLIRPPSVKKWPFEFLKNFRCTISGVLIYYVPESDLLVKCYDYLNISRASVVQFRASLYVIRLIGPPSVKKWPFEFLKSFHCSISGVSIYYVPESDLRVNIYDHLDFSIASNVQFRASWYIMCLNRTSEWKFMTILISRELPFFNFEGLDILCAWIGPPS